jgi:hypothetical protein
MLRRRTYENCPRRGNGEKAVNYTSKVPITTINALFRAEVYEIYNRRQDSAEPYR